MESRDIEDRWPIRVYPAGHIGRMSQALGSAKAEARWQFRQWFGYAADEVTVTYDEARDSYVVEAQGTGAGGIARVHSDWDD